MAESQKKGKTLEQALADLVNQLLAKGGCEIVEGPRLEPGGSQGGRDVIVRFKYPFSAHTWTVAFECKNQRDGRLGLDSLAGKLFQVSGSGLHIDLWVLVAPHVCLANDAYNYLEALQSQFVFNVSFLTPEQKVEEFFALEPDLYRSIYEQEPGTAGDWVRWQKWLLDALDVLRFLQHAVSHALPTMEVVHPREIEKRRASDERHRQKLAQEFYRGQIPTWEHIANDLDFRRSEASQRLAELRQVAQQNGVHFILVLSEAAAGKSTFLMREAFEASKAGTIVLYSSDLPRENLVDRLVTIIRSVMDRTKDRPLMLVLDNVASIAQELRNVILSFHIACQSLTVLAADQTSRWLDAIGGQTVREGTLTLYPRIHPLTLSGLNDAERREFISKVKQFLTDPKVAETTEEELVSVLERDYKDQLVVFLLELLGGERIEASLRKEASDFEAKNRPWGTMYRAVAAFHQFGVSVPESLILRFLNATSGSERQHYFAVLRMAQECGLLNVDLLNRLSTRHEMVARKLFEGLSTEAQEDLLVKLIATIDANEQTEISALSAILVDPSRRSDVWAKPYRRALYETALSKLPDNLHVRDAASLLFIQEGDLERAYNCVKTRRSVVTLQNLARAELKMGHWDAGRALYCEALGLLAKVSDVELLSLAEPGSEIENRLMKGEIDIIVLTDFSRFLSSRRADIAIALLECANRIGKADAYSAHLLARLLRRVDENKAIELLREGRKRFPESAPVFSLDIISILKEKTSNVQDIEAAYKETIEQGWADAYLYLSYARFIGKIRGREFAVGIFRDGIRVAPDQHLILEFASLLQSLGQDEEAEKTLSQGIEKFPLDNAMYTELGRLIQRKQPQKAHLVFQRGLQICPTSAHLHTEYALLLEKEGKLGQAEEIFKEGIAMAPLNGPLFTAFALFLERHGKSGDAEKVFRKGVEQALVRPESLLHELARFLCKHGRGPEAEECFKQGMKRFAWHHHFYVDYGLYLEKQRTPRAALHCYQRGMKNTRDNAPLAQVLGSLLARMYRDEEAVNVFEKGLESANQVKNSNKRKKQQSEIFNEWARLHWYRGQLKDAEQIIRHGIRICPNEPLLHLTLAIVLQSQGKFDSVRDCISEALGMAATEEDRKRMLETFHNERRRPKPRTFKVVATDLKGQVKHVEIKHPRPFGIIGAENGKDYYFRFSKSDEYQANLICRAVEFDLVEYSNGMRRAINVEVTNPDCQ
jgi:tetratricopeptide (TPR) repeat protein